MFSPVADALFDRLWEETGCRAVITELAGKRKHGFALERAVFLTVLHHGCLSSIARLHRSGPGTPVVRPRYEAGTFAECTGLAG